jgi:hypothetical protein
MAADVVHHGRGRPGHAVPLRIGPFPAFERRDAGMEEQRSDGHTPPHQVGDHLGSEGTTGAGHLGAARFPPEDGLVVAQRPLAGDVPVADRSTVRDRVAVDGEWELERGDPQAPRVGEAHQQLHAPSREELDLGGMLQPQGRGAAAVGPTHLDEPDVARQLAREVEDDRFTVGEATVERGRDGCRGIDHEKIAGGEVRAERRELRIEGIGVARAHEQAHAVAAQPTGFGRLVRLVRGVEREVQYCYVGWCGRGHGVRDRGPTSARAS